MDIKFNGSRMGMVSTMDISMDTAIIGVSFSGRAGITSPDLCRCAGMEAPKWSTSPIVGRMPMAPMAPPESEVRLEKILLPILR